MTQDMATGRRTMAAVDALLEQGEPSRGFEVPVTR